MNCDVLVVGAGPVGLTLASELARYGLSVRIVDQAAARTDKSKALVVWSRTLELLDRAGAGAALLAQGYRVSGVNLVANGHRVGRIGLEGAPTPYPFGLMIPQSETERLMDEHLHSLGGAVERSVELSDFTASDSGVVSKLRRADGREESVESAWLVGCDGAHSAVRHQLGVGFLGDTLLSDWVLADVYLTGSNAPTEVEVYWHAEGVLVIFPMTADGRCRIIADIGTGGKTALRPDPSLGEIQTILDRRGPGGIQVSRPVWLAAFRINERKVADYRAGRVFLAGDAAHIHSPAGGQGMNTGMHDACNLAWKLALVQRGLGNSERLLGSYSPERSGVGDQILAATGRLTAVATLHGSLKQTLRNSLAPLILGVPFIREAAAAAATEISIHYPASPLNGPSAHLPHGPKPGERAPIRAGEPPVGAGSSPRFAICAQPEIGGAAVFAAHSALLERNLRAPFHPGGMWLIRPDGYVAMTARQGDWQPVSEYLQSLAVSSP